VLKNAITNKKFSAIQENEEANESDEELLPRRRTELGQMRGTGTSRAGRSATISFGQ